MSNALSLWQTRKRYSIGSLLCIAFAVAEQITNARISPLGLIFALLYIAGLIAIPFRPVPSVIFMCFLATVRAMVPFVVDGPSDYWGSWYALGILTYEAQPLTGIIAVVIVGGSALFDSIRSYGMWGISSTSYSLTFLAAGITGWLLRSRDMARRLRVQTRIDSVQLKAQAERLAMLHELHDSVATSLTYAVLSSRLARSRCAPHSDAAKDLLEVENAVSQALRHLRERVIMPANTSINSEPQDGTVAPAQTGPALDVHRFVREQVEQLSKLRFTPVVSVELPYPLPQTFECVINEFIAEICSNIAKYASQGTVTLSVRTMGTDQIALASSNICKNDGSKGTDHTFSTRTGLASMRKRVEELDGEIDFCCENNEWTISIRLPVAESSHSISVLHKASPTKSDTALQ